MRRIGSIFLLLVLFLVALFAAGAKAQKTTRMSESVDLTDGKPCGAPANKFIQTETIVGKVVKRDFAENETVLKGVVLADKKDQSYYVNIDSAFISDHQSGNFVDDLSDVLTIGNWIRVKADVCGKIYLAVRVKWINQ